MPTGKENLCMQLVRKFRNSEVNVFLDLQTSTWWNSSLRTSVRMPGIFPKYLWIFNCDIFVLTPKIYFKAKTMSLDWDSAQPSAVRLAGFLPNIWSPNHSRGAQSNLRKFHLNSYDPICRLRKDGDGMRGGKGGDGVDQSEYGLNVVDQFPNTGRSVRIGMDTESFYTLTFF